MSSFDYQAVNTQGSVIKGTQVADSAFALRSRLRAQGLTPIWVHEVQQAPSQSDLSWFDRLWHRQLTITQQVLLVRQLATLLEGGLPLAQVLQILAAQADQPSLRRLLSHLHAQIQEGHSLAHAFRSAPYRLPDDVVAMIAAGESTGNLVAVMARLADTLALQAQLRSQMQGALFYPALMLSLSLIIVVFLLSVVVPKVVVMFAHMKQSLPPLTQGLIALSHTLVSGWYWLLLIICIGAVVFYGLWQRPVVRWWGHRFWLRLPLFGRLSYEAATARWSRTLAVLLSSGVPAVDALRISAQVLSWLPLRHAVEQMATQVHEGVPLYRALAEVNVFPSLVRYLVESGELSGHLSDMLTRAAQYYEVSTQQRSNMLIKLVEPLLVIIMGGIVLLIVLAILLPIFSMNQLVG